MFLHLLVQMMMQLLVAGAGGQMLMHLLMM
jgi:hypothetical protein